MKIIIAILIITTSCSDNDKRTSSSNRLDPESQINEGLQNERRTISFEPDSLENSKNISNYLIKKFNIEYAGMEASDIESVQLADSGMLKNFGLFHAYRIKLSNELPEVVTKKNFLILSKEKKLAALFLLDSLFFIQTSVNERTVILGGIQRERSYGYFLMYDYLESGEFIEIINSLNFCETGIPVFNNSIDCESYSPFWLNYKNTDINNDGSLDVNFSGKLLIYCEGLEIGFGRNDRNPIKEKKVNFTFLFIPSKESQIKYALLPESEVCSLFNNSN